MKPTNLAPVALFTYKRLHTLKKVVSALSANFLANETDLFIFSDGPRMKSDEQGIAEVRAYLKTITGFKSIKIKESPSNKGLASSIIEGVTEVISISQKVIVLEDDLITTRNFIVYMNECLEKYQLEQSVYSISGYTFTLNIPEYEQEAYFLNRAWPWGWAIWEDRWKNIDWTMNTYIEFKNNTSEKKRFEKLGSDVNSMLRSQMNGLLDSWYIRFLFHQFKNEGLTIYPKISNVDNAGFDNLATHNKGLKNRYKTVLDGSEKKIFHLPSIIAVNKVKQKAFLSKMSIKSRAINKLNEYFFRFLKLLK